MGHPPSLSALIGYVEGAEEYATFAALVEEFLPDHKREILRQPTPAGQAAAFASRFEDYYFPLQEYLRDGMMEDYGDLTRGIPVIVRGFTWEDYHELPEARLGIRLIAYLLADPYEDEQDGARVALAEACEEHVPQELLRRVPEGGLPQGEAHRLLDGTTYEALALWADILHHDTGNYFWDMDLEWLGDEGLPDWERSVVEDLTREWQQAELIADRLFAMSEGLEHDPLARFGAILDFIETCAVGP